MKTFSQSIDDTGTYSTGVGFLESIAESLALVTEAIIRLLRRRQASRRLHALDDHILKDMGLHRSEIDSVLRHETHLAMQRKYRRARAA